jgi:hypothetical protein
MKYMSNYRGWIISVTPLAIGESWRARVVLWERDQRPSVLPFEETADSEYWIVAHARSAAHAWIDRQPTDRRA